MCPVYRVDDFAGCLEFRVKLQRLVALVTLPHWWKTEVFVQVSTFYEIYDIEIVHCSFAGCDEQTFQRRSKQYNFCWPIFWRWVSIILYWNLYLAMIRFYESTENWDDYWLAATWPWMVRTAPFLNQMSLTKNGVVINWMRQDWDMKLDYH